MKNLMAMIMVWLAGTAAAADFRFDNIDGGDHVFDSWRGQPVLVVNTASRCGFTPQYEGLQALWDQYRDDGLVVLAVPSDDFRQELGNAEAVKDFCAVNFGLTLPMTDITRVTGSDAHPFYRWLARDHGFAPTWNFNKVLIAPDGTPATFWGSTMRPLSRTVREAIEPMLN